MKIRIVIGPVGVDAGWLAEWAQGWAGPLGVELEVASVPDGEELTDAVAAGLAERDGVVVAPGALQPGLADPGPRVVVVDMGEADARRPDPSADRGLAVIRGRGIEGFRWATQWVLQRLEYPFEPRPYGELPDQFADLRLPERDPPHPVAAFLHGGFWRERWLRDTIEPLAVDLARRGYATWNVEYRRAGPSGGGWPATCTDVAAAVDALARLDVPLDLSRVVVVGHSAGAQLAAWVVHRRGIDSATLVRPAAVVLLAGVVDLAEGARRGLSDAGNPVALFLGGRPDELPERYEAASPIANVPLGVPQMVVQGREDSPDFVDMNRAYVAAARAAGDRVGYLEPPGADHFTVITPTSEAWIETAEAIERALPGPG
jgi:acetyl esterase/lipase